MVKYRLIRNFAYMEFTIQERTETYNVKVWDDRHVVDGTTEQALYDLGFKQDWYTHRRGLENDPDGCKYEEYREYNGVFWNGNYEVWVRPDRMLIFLGRANGQPSVDDGAFYSIEDGLIRLEQLV